MIYCVQPVYGMYLLSNRCDTIALCMKHELLFLKNLIQKHVLLFKSDSIRIAAEPPRKDLSFMFDFRAVALDPAFLDAYATLFWKRYGNLGPIQVCGMETAAIPLVAGIVIKGKELGKQVTGLFARKERKLTGLQKSVEGIPTTDSVVIVDDVMNSGRSIEKQLKILADHNLTVVSVFAVICCRERSAYPFLENPVIPLEYIFKIEEFGLSVTQKREVPKSDFTVRWRFQGKNPGLEFVVPKSAPALFENLIICGSDTGTLWALSQHDGNVVWKYRTRLGGVRKGIWSSPLIENKVVYFGAYDGNVYALNAETGKKLWVYRDADWVGSSPTLAPDPGLLFIGLEFGLFRRQGGIAALNVEDGTERWVVRDMPLHTHASPIYMARENLVAIGSNDGIFRCFNAKNGVVRWTFATRGPIKAQGAYDEKTGLVVFGSFDGNVYALDAKTGEERWHYNVSDAVFSNPLIRDEVVYIGGLDKRIHALDARNGIPQWTFATNGRIFASPVIVDGSLWIGSTDGRLYELNNKTGKILSTFQVSERIVNAIAYNEKTDTIFLPTQANELYCLTREKYPPAATQ